MAVGLKCLHHVDNPMPNQKSSKGVYLEGLTKHMHMKLFTTKPRWLDVLSFSLLLLLGGWTSSAVAQSTVTIGSTTVPVVSPATSSYFFGPIYRSSAASSFNYSRYAHLYTAAELGIPNGSIITRVEWVKSDGGTLSGNNTFNVLMNNTSATTLTSGTTWGTLTAGATTTYASTTQTVTGTAGTFWGVNLTSSYVYTGGSLLILLDHVKVGTASAAINFVTNAATNLGIGNAASTAFTSSTTLSTTTYGNRRPTIRITYTLPVPCSGTPAGGTTVASTNPVCLTTPLTLSVSGGATGTGLTYQWEKSTNGGASYSSVSGATSSSLSVPSFAATDTGRYRCVITCTASGLSGSSTPVLVNLNSFLMLLSYQSVMYLALRFLVYFVCLFVSCSLFALALFQFVQEFFHIAVIA